jgi:phosphohistidine swiveling domain-containing protein/6-pyruvoyl-tetrahydropterin synthase
MMILDRTSPIATLTNMGGKALNLYMMNSQGIQIPTWCCISTEYFETFYKQIDGEILKLLSNINLNNLQEIKSKAQQIEDLFLAQELDQNLIDEIFRRFKDVNYMAIRSSAKGEDGKAQSFAGQLSTFLYVPKKDLEQKIKLCMASAFSERAIQYCLLNNIPFDVVKVAIIVQEMIDSEKSGVLFSINPLMTQDFYNQAVITAGYGIGEGIVTDEVETDYYVYDRIKKDVVKSEYKEKKTRMVMAAEGGVEIVSVPNNLSKASVLTRNNITELVSTATALFKFYQHEIDMEWAYDKAGRLYITQARPITTLNKTFRPKEVLLDNSNVVESFPGVNSPWTISVIRDVYYQVFKKAVLRLGFSTKQVLAKDFILSHLIATYKGRVFYNLTHWYEMMRMMPYTESYIKVWEEMLGIEKNEFTVVNKSWLHTIFFSPLRFLYIISQLFWLFMTLDSKLRRLDKDLKKEFENFWRKERKGIYYGHSPMQLMEDMDKFKKQVFQNWDLTLINDIYAFIFTAMVKKIIKQTKVQDFENLFNDIMHGHGEMESVAPVKSLVELGQMVAQDADLASKLEGLMLAQNASVNILTKTESELRFQKKFYQHLNEFGDRGVEELKLETLTYRENPLSLIKMILEYSRSNMINLFTPINDDRKTKAMRIVEKKLYKHPLLKIIFPVVLRLAIRSITYRENFRLHRARGYGVMRRFTNQLAEKLHSLKMIEDPRDLYFLEYDEVFKFSHAMSYHAQLKSLIQLRRDDYSRYTSEQTQFRYKCNGVDYLPCVNIAPDLTSLTLQGQACSSGKLEGEVIVISDVNEVSSNAEVAQGKILVAAMTDPGWVFLMTVSAGLIVEKGSILSHTAIIGRELGIPTIVGVKNATQILKTGDRVLMDGQTGIISILNEVKK